MFAELEIVFEEIPLSNGSSADTRHGVEIWEKGIAGEYGPIADFSEREQQPVVTILPSVTLWERLTEAEAYQVNEAMATQPVRSQRIFTNANTFRSDHELWPLLEQMAIELFGPVPAAELLAE